MKAFIEMTICLTVLFGLYKLILEPTAMHRFKRFYLLGSLILSLTLPFISFEIGVDAASLPTSERLIVRSTESLTQFLAPQDFAETPITIADTAEVTKPNQAKSGYWVFIIIYGLITLMLMIRYFANILKIFRSAREQSHILNGRFKLVLFDKRVVPYNFLNFIFMSQADYEDDNSREALLRHELGHASQRHTLDILFIELLKVIFWFHPLFYIYSKVIRVNHEYLADSTALRHIQDTKSYQLLLLKFINQNNIGLPLTSPSNYSLTKKRLKMMKQKVSKTSIVLRLALLTPLIFMISIFFGIEGQAKELIKDKASSITALLKDLAPQDSKPNMAPIDTTRNFYVFSRHSAFSDERSDDFLKSPGVRFQAQAGTKVLATAEGTIKRIGNETHARGHFLFIDHNEEYETRYFSLSNISVKVGDNVKRGQSIANVGKPKNSKRNQVYYEILKDGEHVNPHKYMEVSLSHIPVIRYLTIVDEKAQKKYGLKPDHHKVNFMYGQRIPSIVYDDERVLFFKHDQEEPVIKEVKDISEEQMKIIRSFTLPPPPTPTYRPPTQAIVDNWHDPKQFGVWIDGKRVKNTELDKYSADDFAFHSVSKLYPNAKNHGKHDYQLNLTTLHMFEVRKKREKDTYNKWFKKTQVSLEKLEID